MRLQQKRVTICLEGIVGAGKTTQIERLYSHFSQDCYLVPELNDISPMKELREELKETDRISNLSGDDAMRLIEARGQIHQKLLKETDKPIILMDRGIYAGMVYESGTLSMWAVEDISKKAGVIVPNICFMLFCPAEKALERVDERRIKVGKYANRAFHENKDYINETKEKYFEIAKRRSLILIETSGTMDDVQNEILGGIYNAGIL